MFSNKSSSIIFGTSGLGNLYKSTPMAVKCKIVEACFEHAAPPVIFDSAGKYGAGLALESLGQCLEQLSVDPNQVIISNKLGWLRTELTTPEPLFEPGVWKDLKFDAVQQISYDGILACYEQGNQLLGKYKAKMVSVHDPDEYLSAAPDDAQWHKHYQDILEAYRALQELKVAGKVSSVGIGAKDWKVIRQISQDVQLDWIMIANSMTIHSHPAELLSFMADLSEKGISVINSAVFNGGFLTGSDYYNYREVSEATVPALYEWRRAFYEVCRNFNITPAQASVAFARHAPGVKAIALNTTDPNRVKGNIQLVDFNPPNGFWQRMLDNHLIDESYLNKYLNE